MSNPICALGRLLPVTPASDSDLRAMRAAAWHKQGVLVVMPEVITDSWERQFLEGMGNRLYGRRNPVAGGSRNGR